MLSLVQDSRQHVVLCAAPGSTLQQEMQLLSQASEVLAASGKQHLAVFAVDPAEQVSPMRPPLLVLGWRQQTSIWDLPAWCLPAWAEWQHLLESGHVSLGPVCRVPAKQLHCSLHSQQHLCWWCC